MIMSGGALGPVLPMIRDEMSASYSQISIVIACLGIVRIFLAVPSGVLADRFDKKKILLVGGFLSIGGLLGLSFSQTIFQLIGSRILIGAGQIISQITTMVTLVHMASPNAKGAMLSINGAAHSTGGIISSALAGILAGWYNWRLPFQVIAVLIFLSMITMAATYTDQRQNYKRAEDPGGMQIKPHLGKNFKAGIFEMAPIFAISLFAFFYRTSFRQTLIPFYAKDVLHIDVVALGFYMSLMRCISTGSMFIFGFASDRYGRKAAVIPGMLFSMIAVMALFLPMELNPLLLACILVGMGGTINNMPSILISDLVPSRSLGRLMGITRIFGDSGYFLGPVIVGSLLDHFGFRIPLYFIATFCVVILILASFSIQNRPTKS
jgi:MFS family permease